MMRRTRPAIAMLMGCTLLASCTVAAGQTPPSSKPQVVAIGDSITAYSSSDIHRALDPDYRVNISARLGKRIDQLLPVLTTSLKKHPKALIENLGTNDAIQDNRNWERSWNQMIGMVKDVPCVVLTTVNALPDELGGGKLRQVSVAADINRRIRHLAEIDPNKYQTVDWNGFLQGLTLANFLHYLVPDLVHPSPGGEQWIASQDKAALSRCGG
jgi:GDSL-like Lipase/Acylhydrolase family